MKHTRPSHNKQSISADGVAEEIQQLQDQLEKLAAKLGLLAPPRDAHRPVKSVMSEQDVRAVMSCRQKRHSIFGDRLFADPAWDMLLELYSAHLGWRKVNTTELGSSSAVPPTTALRWLEKLEGAGLIERDGDKFDHRRMHILLSSKGVAAMQRYFEGAGDPERLSSDDAEGPDPDGKKKPWLKPTLRKKEGISSSGANADAASTAPAHEKKPWSKPTLRKIKNVKNLEEFSRLLDPKP